MIVRGKQNENCILDGKIILNKRNKIREVDVEVKNQNQNQNQKQNQKEEQHQKVKEKLFTLILELDADICPKTCLNFFSLCKGDKKNSQGQFLDYKRSKFSRKNEGYICGGKLENLEDFQGEGNIFGKKFFEDEIYTILHDKIGLISMSQSSDGGGKRHKNSSEFFITLQNNLQEFLDRKYVAFGKVVHGLVDFLQFCEEDCFSVNQNLDWDIVQCGEYFYGRGNFEIKIYLNEFVKQILEQNKDKIHQTEQKDKKYWKKQVEVQFKELFCQYWEIQVCNQLGCLEVQNNENNQKNYKIQKNKNENQELEQCSSDSEMTQYDEEFEQQTKNLDIKHIFFNKNYAYEKKGLIFYKSQSQIVLLEEFQFDANYNCLYYGSGEGDLLNYCKIRKQMNSKGLKLKEIMDIFYFLLQSMILMNKCGVRYTDIKPQNVILRQNSEKNGYNLSFKEISTSYIQNLDLSQRQNSGQLKEQQKQQYPNYFSQAYFNLEFFEELKKSKKNNYNSGQFNLSEKEQCALEIYSIGRTLQSCITGGEIGGKNEEEIQQFLEKFSGFLGEKLSNIMRKMLLNSNFNKQKQFEQEMEEIQKIEQENQLQNEKQNQNNNNNLLSINQKKKEQASSQRMVNMSNLSSQQMLDGNKSVIQGSTQNITNNQLSQWQIFESQQQERREQKKKFCYYVNFWDLLEDLEEVEQEIEYQNIWKKQIQKKQRENDQIQNQENKIQNQSIQIQNLSLQKISVNSKQGSCLINEGNFSKRGSIIQNNENNQSYQQQYEKEMNLYLFELQKKFYEGNIIQLDFQLDENGEVIWMIRQTLTPKEKNLCQKSFILGSGAIKSSREIEKNIKNTPFPCIKSTFATIQKILNRILLQQ
ncbi:Protein kinase-like domain [Pseudocohnilembus persalinus]|uniref:Protein kinase-like domain n=1 Tax=Pseudocohnilembus persalinus TaxID=266149 RepID=A0A0V0QF56_PSEPJ|nr:Protein kinase-like domain [Pseudocohnilembus persalinus]|eukprot:KRX00846.1 Protein kinase-like domain [Pseudocohnilembus persalinus]